MGWGSIKKKIQKSVGKTLGDVERIAMAGASFGTFELLGLGKTAGNLVQYGVDTLTGESNRQKKEEKKKVEAAKAEAQKAADTDYYNRIMKERDRQVAAFLGSRTDMSQDDDALGNYGAALGSFGEKPLGKKKKYY